MASKFHEQYRALELDDYASETEIRGALLKKHPDHGGEGSDFGDAHSAYKTLLSAEAKQERAEHRAIVREQTRRPDGRFGKAGLVRVQSEPAAEPETVDASAEDTSVMSIADGVAIMVEADAQSSAKPEPATKPADPPTVEPPPTLRVSDWIASAEPAMSAPTSPPATVAPSRPISLRKPATAEIGDPVAALALAVLGGILVVKVASSYNSRDEKGHRHDSRTGQYTNKWFSL